jgi:lipoprotein-releasing system permease protein
VNVSLFLARRFLSGKQGGLLGTVSVLALFGVALGTAALVVAMGLMSGYRHELAEKLAGTNAEIIVIPAGRPEPAKTIHLLASLPHVTAVARTAFASGLLLSPTVPSGVDAVVKGLDLPAGLRTTKLLGSVPGLEAKLTPRPGAPMPALLGAGLAERLGAKVDTDVVLESASASSAQGIAAPRRTLLRVKAVVETGFSEVDDSWVVVPLSLFDVLAPPDVRQGLYELKLTAPSLSDQTVAAARKALDPSSTIVDWKALNRDLFAALAVQQTLLFVVLALIVAVAAGTIVSALVVLLAAKTRDVGVLATLGATPKTVVRTFRFAGLFLGGAGILLGTLFGTLVCLFLTAFRVVRFPPAIAKVYYLSWMPFRPEPLHLVAIVVTGLLLVLVASILPARRAARLDPAEALRYE